MTDDTTPPANDEEQLQKFEDRMMGDNAPIVADETIPPGVEEKLNLMYIRLTTQEELLAQIAVDKKNPNKVFIINPVTVNVVFHPMTQSPHLSLDEWIAAEFVNHEEAMVFPMSTSHIVTYSPASELLTKSYIRYMMNLAKLKEDVKDKEIVKEQERAKKIVENTANTISETANTLTANIVSMLSYDPSSFNRKTVH